MILLFFWARGRPYGRLARKVARKPGGKPDRMILSRLEWARERGAFVAPEGKAEKKIAMVWQEVLGWIPDLKNSWRWGHVSYNDPHASQGTPEEGYSPKYMTCKQQ